MIPAPPQLEDLKAFTSVRAGLDTALILPDLDFETYSPAGFIWNSRARKWEAPNNASKKGLSVVGAVVYTEHPDAEVLSLAYNLKDGNGIRVWTPKDPPPHDLLGYVLCGYVLEAWNCSFEYWVWNNICVRKYSWPPLPQLQLMDAMAKSRAFGLPGSLDAVGKVLNLKYQKDKRGWALLQKFSIPRNPTQKNKNLRILPEDEPGSFKELVEYNIQDIKTEADASHRIPDLNVRELEFWRCDQAINIRGVQIDIDAVYDCISIIEQAHEKYNAELFTITDGVINSASEVQKILRWVNDKGTFATTLDAEIVEYLLRDMDLKPEVRRVLEIRNILSSAAVKKLYAMANQVSSKGRLHDLFIYHSARTGRAAGAGPQPQNLPNTGPWLIKCRCGHYRDKNLIIACPWCGEEYGDSSGSEWNIDAVEDALKTIKTQSLSCVELYWDNAIEVVSGCLRSMFIAAPNHTLLCSDYSAIEAVVLAALAGEEWRMEVFRTHGKIYEMSASKITGIPFEEFEHHKKTTGQHHPMRKKVGKVAELASGYQGWIGAWKQFGADEFFNDDEIKKSILAWRDASPGIVAMWGSQKNGLRGLEGMAIAAVMEPGKEFDYRGIKYLVYQDVLYCKLLSGRYITYHKPRLGNNQERGGLQLTFETWNTNPKYGKPGWVRMSTYGGKLTENVVQATARDILAHAIIKLEELGFPVVLHIHDEIVVEIPNEKLNTHTLERFELIMSSMPSWAAGWPIKAQGGWQGQRYRKG